MSRKQELNERANRVGIASMGPTSDIAAAFEQGYRTALRDARRAYNSHRRYSLRCIALVEWLRPLR